MTSTLVFLGCLGVLVPQQSPKLPEEPSEAQLLAIITNAYRENYGKIRNCRASIKTRRAIKLNGINPAEINDKMTAEMIINEDKIKFEAFSKSGEIALVAIKGKDIYTVIDHGNARKEVLIGEKKDLTRYNSHLIDLYCYGNNSNLESIPEVLGKIKKLKISTSKQVKNSIVATGTYSDNIAVRLEFSKKNNYLCSYSLFQFNSDGIEQVNETFLEYDKLNGTNLIFPKNVKMDFKTYVVEGNKKILAHTAEDIHVIELKIDKTIGEEVFNLKIPDGYEVIDLTKGAKAPANNIK